MVCWEVIPFLGSSVHECGLAHSSFSSRKMKFSVVSQDPTTEVGSQYKIALQLSGTVIIVHDSYNR